LWPQPDAFLTFSLSFIVHKVLVALFPICPSGPFSLISRYDLELYAMRIKQLWSVVPAPAKLRLLWERITLSRLTIVYFAFSVVHCIIQLVLQIRAFTINAEAAATLYQITLQGNATNAGFPVLGHDLRICSTVPHNLSAHSCPVFWDGSPGTENAWNSTAPDPDMADTILPESSSAISSTTSPLSSSSLYSDLSTSATGSLTTVTVFEIPNLIIRPTTTFSASIVAQTGNVAPHDGDDDNLNKREDSGGIKIQSVQVNGTIEVTVNGSRFSRPAVLERSCIWALNYPVAVLLDTKREDIVFVAFQLWVLGMSTVALLHESMPHIIASLLTHVLATAWAGFQLVHTADFHRDFVRLTVEGACKPINLLPFYWQQRRSAELSSLILNIVALFVSAFLTWKLVKLFGWQTFKRVGASLTIHRIYKTTLVLAIILQLSLFFITVTAALWIDQLYNGSIGHLSTKPQLDKALDIVTLILLIPWLTTGWLAVRREMKIPMMIFLVLTIGYLAGLCTMFLSDTFRWTFMEWRFFSLVALASVVLATLAFILGVVCRFNFGKGLPHYLNAEEILPGDDFEPAYPSDVEKFDFPSNEKVIPTFAATLDVIPSASDMTIHNESVEVKHAETSIAFPFTVHVRSPSDGSSISRHDASNERTALDNSSDSRSHSRTNSNRSQASDASIHKRWVIE
jgi:hypothetical protein